MILKKEVLPFVGRRAWNGRDTVNNIREPMPLVEIADNRRVLIEHHKGVVSYTSESITVQVRFGQICVRGSRLCISRMTCEQLVICGRILEVALNPSGGSHE